MAENIFHFKQFSVKQDLCAMKVGTDGVLLGSWVNGVGAKRILDVGCGSGLIAIMLAQRSNATIDAIDIDESAFVQAKENILNCNWKERLNCYHISLQDHALNSKIKYDLVVSNPPFFTNALKPENESRAKARHNHLLSFNDLIVSSWSLLTDQGVLSFILPFSDSHYVMGIAKEQGFFVKRTCEVRPGKDKAPKRMMVEFSKSKIDKRMHESIVIEEEKRHDYTTEYMNLTKEYYLKF